MRSLWRRRRGVIDDDDPPRGSRPVVSTRVRLNVLVVGDEEARSTLQASAEARSDQHLWVVGAAPADVVIQVTTGQRDIEPFDECPNLLWARDVVGAAAFVQRALDQGFDAVVLDGNADVVIAQLNALIRRPPASASTKLLEASTLLHAGPAAS